MKLEYDDDEIKWAICDRYTAGEIVELLGVSSEEIYEGLTNKIKNNIEVFELINLSTDYFFTDTSDEVTIKINQEEEV